MRCGGRPRGCDWRSLGGAVRRSLFPRHAIIRFVRSFSQASAVCAHERSDSGREDRLLELAREEEDRLGSNIEPWVSYALANQWRGGPTAALDDAARLLRQAQSREDAFWELTAILQRAELHATLIRVGGLSSDVEMRYLAMTQDSLRRAEAFGQPSGIGSASAALGLALRDVDSIEALALLERSRPLRSS